MVKWRNNLPKYSNRARRATEIGRVVVANRIEIWEEYTNPASLSELVHATYIYEVNGKTYKYKYLEREITPLKIELFYLNNPKKHLEVKKIP